MHGAAKAKIEAARDEALAALLNPEEAKKRQTLPHLLRLTDDPMCAASFSAFLEISLFFASLHSSEVLAYYCDAPATRFCDSVTAKRLDGKEATIVHFTALGMEADHAIVAHNKEASWATVCWLNPTPSLRVSACALHLQALIGAFHDSMRYYCSAGEVANCFAYRQSAPVCQRRASR